MGSRVVEDARDFAIVAARALAGVEFPVLPPRLRDGVIPRPRLVDRLAESTAKVALVNAPAGYGKTTLLEQWAAADPRPCAWVAATEADNDRPGLLAHLLLALDRVQPIGKDTLGSIVFSQADLTRVVVPRLGVLISDAGPFVLMIDDAHLLRSRAAIRILRAVVDHLPEGACVAFAGRGEPDLPIARWRANREVIDLRYGDLAMLVQEGKALLHEADAGLPPVDAARLVQLTEGWPAGLYLGALAARDRGGLDLDQFGGDDEIVGEYFIEEVLRTLDEQRANFLLWSSVLERLSAAKCDDILEREGSAAVLDELVRSNRFLMPIGRSGEWYRYHPMFRDLLRAELRRRDPRREVALSLRASEWWVAHGDADAAIGYARAAGDVDRVAALIWRNVPLYVGSGRTATIVRWLEPFTYEAIASSPELTLAAAWAAFTSGDTDDMVRWLAVSRDHPGDAVLADGATVEAAVALVSVHVAERGLTAAREDATTARERYPEGPWRAQAFFVEGIASRLIGEPDRARLLNDARSRASVFLPATEAHAMTQLALLRAEDGSWDEAERLVGEALRIVDTYGLGERPAVSEIFAAAARIHARTGRGDVKDLAKHGVWLVSMLVGVAPFVAIDARALLVHALAAVGEVGAAHGVLAEARSLVEEYPDAGRLGDLVAEAAGRLDALEIPLGVAAAPLTPAEHRVLQYLPTHLSFAEIADEIFVSRNTVKTQAIAVYRKLGVSSRTAAVQRARDAGLLDR